MRQSGLMRRLDPQLNERAWIVVPFANVMRAPELDWLHDASVELLTLDLERWTDIKVVDDKRVADLLRELPDMKPARALTLNEGLLLARHAGAGKLVMGEYFKLGSGARIVANVFDVKTGKSIRTITQQSDAQDSLLTAFSPIARDCLGVPPPPDAKLGAIGTTRIDAYQEYLEGIKALYRFQIEESVRRFNRALALDSTFALAHFELSIALEWGDGAVDPAITRPHALAAQRLGTTLPPRERALIDGRVFATHQEFGKACAKYAPVVAKDSSDVLALQLYGECSFHDHVVEPAASDTLPGRFQGNWNAALVAFRRVLQLEPANETAFAHILEILTATNRQGCVYRTSTSPCEPFEAVMLRSGDTLELRPVSDSANKKAWYDQEDRSAKEKPVIANMGLARRIAEDWVASDSTNEHAQGALITVLLRSGDLQAANTRLAYLHPRAVTSDFEQLWLEIEIAAKTGRAADARAWFDSLVKAIPDAPAPARLIQRGSIDLMFGRFDRLNRGLAAWARSGGPAAVAYWLTVPRVVIGLPASTTGAAEAAFLASRTDTTCKGQCKLDWVYPTITYGLRVPRTQWPPMVPLKQIDDGREKLVVALARGDTTQLRRQAVQHDSLARRNVEMGWPDFQWTAIATEGFLALHDSTAALKAARFYVDTAMVPSPVLDQLFYNAFLSVAIWPRMMLIRAELADKLGYKDEARTWYTRVLDLWANADAELAPDIARIRAERAALGPPK